MTRDYPLEELIAGLLPAGAVVRAGPIAPAGARLHFVSIEAHPLAAADLACMTARWPALSRQAARIAARWPAPVAGTHRVHLDDRTIDMVPLDPKAKVFAKGVDYVASFKGLDWGPHKYRFSASDGIHEIFTTWPWTLGNGNTHY